MSDERLQREAAALGIILGPDGRPHCPAENYDPEPIIDLDDPELSGATTLEEALEGIGGSAFSTKVLCAAGVMLAPFVYPPFADTADEVAVQFEVDRRTVQAWKARKPPMPWKADWYYSLPQIEYWHKLTFSGGARPAHYVLAIGKVIRGDLAALLKRGETDPAKLLAVIPTAEEIACALWDTREE